MATMATNSIQEKITKICYTEHYETVRPFELSNCQERDRQTKRHKETYRQKDKQTVRQTLNETCGQWDRQERRQTDRSDKQITTHKDGQTEIPW